MILLDTNVVSEGIRAQPAEQLYVSAIPLGEIAYGLRILPDGQRRSGLRERSVDRVCRGHGLRRQPFPRAAAVRGTLQRRSMAGICGPTTSRVVSRSGGVSTR